MCGLFFKKCNFFLSFSVSYVHASIRNSVENRNYCMLFVFHFRLLQVFLLVFWSWKLVEPERYFINSKDHLLKGQMNVGTVVKF